MLLFLGCYFYDSLLKSSAFLRCAGLRVSKDPGSFYPFMEAHNYFLFTIFINIVQLKEVETGSGLI